MSCTDLKPENLLYLTPAADSPLVLADFGIAKHLDSPSEKLTTMAGSFGYAAPEVMLRQPHGKAVDMWSLGVITYTLLCGYSPFRSENLQDLIDECTKNRLVFHERYWRDVSEDAKEFILTLLQPEQNKRATSEQALQHRWLKGETATDHNLLPELRAYMAKARLKRGIELVKLANRIESLKLQEDDEDISPGEDIPSDPTAAAREAPAPRPIPASLVPGSPSAAPKKPSKLSKAARSAIFREVVLAKVREMKQQEQKAQVEKAVIEKAEKEKSGFI
jgi:calcium/calmodulin-dependent protein kinase I